MTIEIRKAERMKSLLRLAIAGVSGSGKTMGALKLAKGIGDKILMIDTERGSGDLYASLFDYDITSLAPPFKPESLVEAIHAGEAGDYDVIIIDSLSHFWADEGGLLDQADKLQQQGKNRFTLWADITPQHRRLVNAMLNSTKHIIATMRSKQEYAMESDDKGRASVKKLGMAPVQREGMEYEFTVFFDVDQNHHAKATKDRTSMFNNEFFVIDEKVGNRIKDWLNTGKDKPVVPEEPKAPENRHFLTAANALIDEAIQRKDIAKLEKLAERVEASNGFTTDEKLDLGGKIADALNSLDPIIAD